MAILQRLLPLIRRIIQPLSFWILVLLLATSPVWLTALEDQTGPSTSYFDQVVASAHKGRDGKEYIYPGDQILIRADIIRHSFNGTCHLGVWRVRENIGGPDDGAIHLMQHVDQEFIGDGLFRHTSWPIAPAQIVVDKSWFDDPATTRQTLDMFVVGRYYCNFLDYLMPRFLHSADGDLSPAFLDRNRHTVGFTIPGWDPHSGFEGGHSRVILKRAPDGE
jgi:hypothetical protein